MKKSAFFFVTSFLIVALGQPDASVFFSFLSSTIGFALFWVLLLEHPQKKKRFWLSTFWYGAVQAVQLAWLATPDYQGIYIYFVYLGLIFLLGLEFGLLSLLFPKSRFSFKRLLIIAAFWTLLEWSRLFAFCGFVWNPVGLSLSTLTLTSQLASLGGVFCLSFWAILTNLSILNFYIEKKKVQGVFAAAVFLFPYFFGFIHLSYHDKQKEAVKNRYNVALIQTALKPDQKNYFFEKQAFFISPYLQWASILNYLKEYEGQNIDLIVLPEAALPFSAKSHVYSYEQVQIIFSKIWDKDIHLDHLLSPHFAEEKQNKWYVNNLFWAQSIADHYGAEVILGLDDSDQDANKSYNAAFHLTPRKTSIMRYEKRVLLPLAEYLPLSFLKPLVARYGIAGFFSHGKEAKVFSDKLPLSISICYEECFSHLIREGRKRGAKLFVNVSNDGWYPFSRLPAKHFYHGKLRAIENGVPLVRACNTGITGAVDSLGRVISIYKEGKEWERGALIVSFDLYSYSTLYTLLGDTLIIGLSFLCLGLLFFDRREST